MLTLRRLALRNRHLAVVLLALVLAMKLLVPTGYMVSNDSGRILVSICTGFGPQTMVMEMPGMAAHHGADDTKKDAKAEMPCAFAGLGMPALGGVDPVLLVAALAAVAVAALLAITALPAPARLYLRPPLRGPPAAL